MKRKDFVEVAEEALHSLAKEFRSRIRNVAIRVEDLLPNESPLPPGHQRRLLLGIFHRVPATEKSDLMFQPRPIPSRDNENVKDHAARQIPQCNLFATQKLRYVPLWCFSILMRASASAPWAFTSFENSSLVRPSGQLH